MNARRAILDLVVRLFTVVWMMGACLVASEPAAWRTCATCHGNDGDGNPTQGIPRLAGQIGRSVMIQLDHFRSGTRAPITQDATGAAMVAAVRQLSDREMDQIIRHVVQLDVRDHPQRLVVLRVRADVHEPLLWCAPHGRRVRVSDDGKPSCDVLPPSHSLHAYGTCLFRNPAVRRTPHR